MNKTIRRILNCINQAKELCTDKFLDSERGSRQSAYYKGKINMCSDTIGCVNSVCEKRKKVVYVSHPYGNEEYNLYKSDKITLYLIKNNPDILFINPLRACGWSYNDLDYEVGLRYCFDILDLCDEMWVCNGWKDSKGCKEEIEYCKSNNIPYKFLNTYCEVEE